MKTKKIVNREIIELIGFILKSSDMLEPPCDVFEKEGRFYVDLEIAGLDENNFKIDVFENSIAILGVKKKNSVDNARYVRAERIFGTFKKTVDFPVAIKNIESVSYKKGILRIVVNKG